jgi:(p)ppGpp synthase/HD superfamily hydrolase
MFKSFDPIVELAVAVAIKAHTGQKRDFTGEDYIVHPIHVGHILTLFTEDSNVIAAGILHDVEEDTTVTFDNLYDIFGSDITDLVRQVSKVSVPSDGNRAVRKAIDEKHYSSGSPGAQTIKLADIFSNSLDVATVAPKFAKVYLPEQLSLANSLKFGNKDLQNLVIKKLFAEMEKL